MLPIAKPNVANFAKVKGHWYLRTGTGNIGNWQHFHGFYRMMMVKAHGLFFTEKDCAVPTVSVPKTS